MNSTRTPLLQRLLEGRRTWGTLDVSVGRYGATHYRLVVYPPGSSRDERIALRLWRTFPTWGLATWLVTEVVLMTALTPGLAFTISTGACLAAAATMLALTGHTRGNVRMFTVVRMLGVNDPTAVPRLNELRELAERLAHADARLAAGELSTVAHEAEVWHVYDRMPTY